MIICNDYALRTEINEMSKGLIEKKCVLIENKTKNGKIKRN